MVFRGEHELEKVRLNQASKHQLNEHLERSFEELENYSANFSESHLAGKISKILSIRIWQKMYRLSADFLAYINK